ncbi:cupin domain-containing protein [Novosphingobium sp. EMRT-2]|uniref:cupin domain-containing protein n=1 Tax=Novosphingobium sp. EMRT-2 TaxID=2571749 RepID=UPI0010BDDB62|nr:cupin domain-containing protein [Novosphingobium sp. EMRT-2]QCI95038.1 cupin domain-containing protein [Novosphingobium sp. EMRT-2]
MASAPSLIATLGLSPHPEGGWYRETWRAPAEPGTRGAATAILFLLEAGQSSYWHRVDAAEIWLWHGGDALDLRMAADDRATPETFRLGSDVAAGQSVQAVVPEQHWQAASPVPDGPHGYTLVSCVVAPAFEFSGFTLAPPGWEPGA